MHLWQLKTKRWLTDGGFLIPAWDMYLFIPIIFLVQFKRDFIPLDLWSWVPCMEVGLSGGWAVCPWRRALRPSFPPHPRESKTCQAEAWMHQETDEGSLVPTPSKENGKQVSQTEIKQDDSIEKHCHANLIKNRLPIGREVLSTGQILLKGCRSEWCILSHLFLHNVS